MARRQYADDPPYKLSRAAMRERYGSRSIDASASQSSLDQTPSGRLKYIEQQGFDPEEAKFFRTEDFRNNFIPRPAGFERPQDRMAATQAVVPTPSIDVARRSIPYTNPSFPSAVPATISGSSTPSPTPLSFNLSEASPYSASDIAPYVPPSTDTYTPSWKKKPSTNGMGSILEDASKWLPPTYSTGQPVPKFHQDFNRFMDRAAPGAASAVMQATNPVLPILQGAQGVAGGLSDLVDPSTAGGPTIKGWLNYFSGRKNNG